MNDQQTEQPSEPVTPHPWQRQQRPAMHVGFSSDFKSCALWALLGTVGGVCLGVWLCHLTKKN